MSEQHRHDEDSDYIPYKYPLILSFSVDRPENSSIDWDFCLGRADFDLGRWMHDFDACDSTYDEDEDKFSFKLQRDGIYTVLFSP